MNDSPEHRDLEQLLAGRPLTPPSAKLDQRMTELFASAASHDEAAPHRFAPAWVRVVRGVAAVIAIGGLAWLAVQMSRPQVPQTTATKDGSIAVAPPTVPKAAPQEPMDFRPVRIEQVWSDTRPAGLVMVDGDPLRRFHRQTVKRVQLIDEKSNVRIEYTVPRDELVVMPARYD